MTQPTISGLDRARDLFASAVGDSPTTQIAVGLIQLILTAKRAGSMNSEQTTANAVLSKLAIEGPMRSADLSHFLQLDPSTVSRQICTMVDENLVTKSADEHDRRVQWIALTPTGQEALYASVRSRTEQFAKVTEAWTEEERETFGTLLATFVTDFDRTLNESEHA